MLAIKNNIMASNAARHLGKAYDGLAKSVERLASGLRINSAKDDAAGLAVRELIRADIAVLQQGSRNASDGISMLQTMEGAMGVVNDALIRMSELAEQAATGSYSSAQRTIMNAEFAEMAAEIERIAGATKFNDISMLNTATGSVSIHVGTTSTIDVDKVDMTQSGLSITTGNGEWSIMTNNTGYATMTETVLDVAVTAASGNAQYDITFGSEQVIDAVFASNGGASSNGQYNLQEVIDAINLASQNPTQGYDASGNSLSYAAAEVVETAAGNYKIQISARDTAATTLSITSEGAGTAGDITGIFGTLTTGSIMTLGIFEKSDTNGAWESDTLGVVGAGINILTEAAAVTALATITTAINTKDSARATFGYKMNRLESTIAILDIQAENLMAAESRISDVDVATEMATLTRTQVLSQAGIAMLAQANAMPQMALTLLR
ncbi:MAG: flagellin N-terminal helical domain-containing protein [Planctomycetota bacterium]|jgi:flagellin